MAESTGQLGEEAAAVFLQRQGYQIIARNWRSRFGEVDIIAKDGRALVLIEVKTRSRQHGRFGTPVDAVTPDKVRRLSRLALDFAATYRIKAPIRLDVVAVAGERMELIRGVEPIDNH